MTFHRLIRRPAVGCLRRTLFQCTSKPTPRSSLPPSSIRPFSSLLRSTTRPTYLPSSSTSSTSSSINLSASALSAQSTRIPSLSSSSSSSSGMGMGGGAMIQVRGHKRKTYNPSHLVRKRRFGFLARLHSRTGKNIIKRRRAKGRKYLSH